MSETQTNSPSVKEKSLIHEQDTTLIPLSKEDVLVPGVADKHPRDMPEMAFVIAFCIQYNEAVGNLSFLPEELEDAIVRREPVDLVERVHRYFLRNVLNFSKIIDKRYWIRKLSEHLQERIEKKEFILSYNPFDRIKKNRYHELSNFEKVMILKDLVMWQLKGSERIQAMWQLKESEKIQTLHQDTENVVRPVEVEVLGIDSKGSTYFYLGVGARIYREIPSVDDTQQCVWEALTTTLQDLKDLVSDRVEIDPDRSEEERILYKRISEELIPDIESQIEAEREEAARRKKSGKKAAKSKIRYNKSLRKVPSTEETDDENNTQADVTTSDVEPVLSVSMWSVTRPSTNLQPVQTVHDVRCFPANQRANSASNDITTVNPTSQWDEDDDVSTTTSSGVHEKGQSVNQSKFTERQNTENGTLKNVTHRKRRMEEETSDDDSNDSEDYLESNKRVKFGFEGDESYHDSDTSKRSSQVKGKGVLRNEPYDNLEFQNVDIIKSIDDNTAIAIPKDKGKNVLRHEGSSQIVEGSYEKHYYNTANVDNLSEVVNREIFRPGPEELTRLKWSLNHVFFEGLEIFGEDSDSELSECCEACIMEVDHLPH